MGNIRTNRNGSVMGQGDLINSQNNVYSGAQKMLQVGPDFYKNGTNAFVNAIDASSGSTSVAPSSILWLYNNSSTVAWLALSTAAIASAPTGFTNGIPLTPNAWTYISTGLNSFMQTSASTVGVYIVRDDTFINIIP